MRLWVNTYTFVDQATYQMNIGIFEMEHFETAYPLIRLFDIPQNRLVIYTDLQTSRRLSDLLGGDVSRYSWALRDDNEPLWRFLYRMKTDSSRRRLDLLLFNTISHNHVLFAILIALLYRIRVIVTIHDINCLWRSVPGRGIKNLFRHIGKRRLINEVKEFNVISDTMIPYLRVAAGNKKTIHNIPGAVYETRRLQKKIGPTLRVTVPGSIEQKRRDYNQVFDLLNFCEAHKTPTDIVLLGGQSDLFGTSVIEQAKKYSGNYTRIFCYETTIVPQEQFDIEMDNADFILIPSITQIWICENIPEMYGITKSSGSIYDVIRFAKPFFVPYSLHIPRDMETSVTRYKTIADIVPVLQRAIDDPEYCSVLQQQARAVSEFYTIESIRTRNASLFQTQASSSNPLSGL